MTRVVTEFARAKVNLTLHVLARRPDGFHDLESLVVFPEIGDTLEAEASGAGLSLTLAGPYGGELDAGGDNLVLRAASLLQARSTAPRGAALRLIKRLPVASGIGGGSAVAAAAFRVLQTLWSPDAPLHSGELDRMAASLGSDIPVCLRQPVPSIFEGAGERIRSAPPLPRFWMLLANPGEPLSTADVFRARPEPMGAGPALPDAFSDLDALVAWLRAARNDLAQVAERLRPAIAEVRQALERTPGCRFARMSGSGATCFGLFENEGSALEAEVLLREQRPAWWVAAGPVNPPTA